MKRRIKRIAPLSVGKILGLLYACMGLLILPFFALGGMASIWTQQNHSTQNSPPTAVIGAIMAGVGFFLPVIYGALGFVGGIIMAALYNFFARWTGGIEVEVEEKS